MNLFKYTGMFVLVGLLLVACSHPPVMGPSTASPARLAPTNVETDSPHPSPAPTSTAEVSGEARTPLAQVSQAPPNLTQVAGRMDQYTAANLEPLDLANRGDGSDLGVRFEEAQDSSQVDEYRLLIRKADSRDPLEVEIASALPESRTMSLRSAPQGTYFRLATTARDTDGDLIEEGISYLAQVLSVGPFGAALSAPSSAFELANEASVHTLVPEFPSATGGLAVDGQGNIYAANIGRSPSRNGDEIYRITPRGQVGLWVAGQGLNGASGNAIDSQGNLYQSSLRASAIHRITPQGAVTEFAREGMSGPVGIALAPDGTLFVANCRGNSIQRLTPEGESSRFAESNLFGCPNGITMDKAGNLYVANFTGGDVLKVTPQGEVQEFAKVPGGNNGHIIFHRDSLFVVSRGGHQVYTLSLEGELAPLAGTGERGHADGPASQATFSLPNDIVVSPDGERLYINEVVPTSGTANIPSRIRVLELPRRDGPDG